MSRLHHCPRLDGDLPVSELIIFLSMFADEEEEDDFDIKNEK